MVELGEVFGISEAAVACCSRGPEGSAGQVSQGVVFASYGHGCQVGGFIGNEAECQGSN